MLHLREGNHDQVMSDLNIVNITGQSQENSVIGSSGVSGSAAEPKYSWWCA
jgi:hypothetical protein